MAKRLGPVDQMNTEEVKVECLEGLNNHFILHPAQIIAQYYAKISNTYSPVDTQISSLTILSTKQYELN